MAAIVGHVPVPSTANSSPNGFLEKCSRKDLICQPTQPNTKQPHSKHDSQVGPSVLTLTVSLLTPAAPRAQLHLQLPPPNVCCHVLLCSLERPECRDRVEKEISHPGFPFRLSIYLQVYLSDICPKYRTLSYVCVLCRVELAIDNQATMHPSLHRSIVEPPPAVCTRAPPPSPILAPPSWATRPPSPSSRHQTPWREEGEG